MKAQFLLALALLLAAGPGFANTIDQSKGLTLLDVGSSFGAPVEFDPFNPALGVLTDVTLSLEASFSGTVGVENVSGSPDIASGIIAGSVTISTTGNLLSVEVTPDAQGPAHDLAPFDGVLDYAGASGATDSVSGADVSASAAAPPPASALGLFTGTEPIFLTLTATSFPIAEGLEAESVTDSANASASVRLTYDYTPAASVPEPGTLTLGMVGAAWLLGLGRRRSKRAPSFASS